MDYGKAVAELDVLREFIDFINQQVGVYSDCLSGFEGNKVRIERQIARVSRADRKEIRDGQPTIVYVSLEDPSRPDVIHHRITRSDEFPAANAGRGLNERQICWSIIVFLFARWDEDIRPRIADIRGVKPNEVTLDELGDLRILRKCIVHNAGKLKTADHARLKTMQGLFAPDEVITPSHDDMHKVFVLMKQSIARLILKYTGDLRNAPKPEKIVGIAIQKA